MSPAPVVLDASVAIKLVVAEDRTQHARALVAECRNAAVPMIVPPHFHGEIANGLHQQVRRQALTQVEGRQALDDLLNMGFQAILFDDLPRVAFDFASQRGLAGVYDALYIVLAERMKTDFWTDDRRLLSAVAQHAPWVRWIGDFEAA